MSLENFVINFWVSYINETAQVKFITVPPVPSSTDITTTINSLISYLQTNGISLSNYGMVSTEVESLSNKISSMSGGKYSKEAENLKTSTASKDQLIAQLQSLKSKLQTNVSDLNVTLPSEDTGTSPSSSINCSKRSTRKGGTSKVTTNETIGQLVGKLQANSTTSSATFKTFVNKVKAVFSQENQAVSTSGGAASSAMTTSSKPKFTGKSNNIFNKIADGIINRRGMTNRNTKTVNKPVSTSGGAASTSGAASSAKNQLLSYVPPDSTTADQTSNEQTVSTDYYDIETSIVNNYLQVSYSLFEANTTTSVRSFTFTLTPESLISLSYTAYKSAKNSTTSIKSQLVTEGRGDTIETTADSDLWNSYLLWLFSYLSTGVGSQLYDTPIQPFPGSSTNSSVNYMMEFGYLNAVGNLGLTVQKASLSTSEQQAMLDVSIPYKWPSMMYSFDRNRFEDPMSVYVGKSIVSLIKSETAVQTD